MKKNVVLLLMLLVPFWAVAQANKENLKRAQAIQADDSYPQIRNL